jgi:hypothetical protein
MDEVKGEPHAGVMRRTNLRARSDKADVHETVAIVVSRTWTDLMLRPPRWWLALGAMAGMLDVALVLLASEWVGAVACASP